MAPELSIPVVMVQVVRVAQVPTYCGARLAGGGGCGVAECVRGSAGCREGSRLYHPRQLPRKGRRSLPHLSKLQVS